ncbi:MAG: hypothetical protein LUE99_04610 [Bacteroides sp.]|nr:hypothetical protein [Bacteroides sp.]
MNESCEILVFRTSVSKKSDIKQIGRAFREYPQINRWTVDFEDWEKVLRIECREISADRIITLLRGVNIYAQELV